MIMPEEFDGGVADMDWWRTFQSFSKGRANRAIKNLEYSRGF